MLAAKGIDQEKNVTVSATAPRATDVGWCGVPVDQRRRVARAASDHKLPLQVIRSTVSEFVSEKVGLTIRCLIIVIIEAPDMPYVPGPLK